MMHIHTKMSSHAKSGNDSPNFVTKTGSAIGLSYEIIMHMTEHCIQPRTYQQHVQQANHWLASLTLTPQPLLTWNRTALSRVDDKLCGSVAAGWYIICHVTEGLIVF